MLSFARKYRLLLIIAAAVICAVIVLLVFRSSRTDLLNKPEFSTLSGDIRDAASDGRFGSQEDLADYITSWADSHQLEYKTDSSGNIIIVSDAVDRKKNISPTVVLVSYNYQTASRDAVLLASAAMIAGSDLSSGRRTVVFVNDDLNQGKGYRKLSSKLITDKSKVIYIDSGRSSYLSTSSFARKYQTITVKGSMAEPECDTAVRIHISGINTAVIGPAAGTQPDPVSELGTLLSRLKSRSSIYQLSDFETGSNGSMYPVSIDADIMLNSYAVPSFTKYVDKRIKTWEKQYSDDYQELTYTYEIIDDPEQLPESAYSRLATERLTNILYTLQKGRYIYGESDSIPEGRSSGDTYGINAIIGMRPGTGSILIDLMTQARDDEAMQRISDDNTASAELFGCSIRDTSSTAAFTNSRDSLSRTFKSTYFKINGVFNPSDVLGEAEDNYFTPCSYIAEKNSKADIIHIRLSADNAAKMTNTILCYIAYKGNILF